MSCQGVVRSFNDSKGWGFIAYDGSDVFVHIKDCQGGKPVVGDTVAFEMDPSKASSGQMKALTVVGGTGSLDDTGKGCGKGKGNGKVVGTGAYQGNIKSFNESKGWGFIDCEGQDVFCHIKDIADGGLPQAGDVVTFDAEESPSKPGSMRAKNVCGGSGWPSGGGGDAAWGCAAAFGKGGKAFGGCVGYGPAWSKGPPCWAGAGPYGCGGKDAWGKGGGCWGGDAGCWGKGW